MVRVKRRYIVLKFCKRKNKENITEHELMDEIKNQVESCYGDFGLACLRRGFVTKKFDDKDCFAVIQVRKGAHEMVMSVIPLINRINDKDCSVNIIHLSGTLRGSFKILRIDYIRNLRAVIAEKMALESSSMLSPIK
jgi:RNase P/RNase MRP subunit POP5